VAAVFRPLRETFGACVLTSLFGTAAPFFPTARLMPYHVVAFTLAQVRQGSLAFQRQLSGILRDSTEIKVYSASPFDLDERRRIKDRFGGDVVYFFNEAARQECIRLGLDVKFIAEIPDEQLPRRRALIVGVPDQRADRPA
jgi:hypothetical protein